MPTVLSIGSAEFQVVVWKSWWR